jgi:hypothetical protein
MENAPQILTPTWPSSSGSGMLIMLDLDFPLDDTRVSSLHWLVTGLTPSSTSPTRENPANLTIPNSAVEYQQPAPPIGDVAHTYAFYLIAPLPTSFTLPSSAVANRTPFDLRQFLADGGLSEENVIARNHFRVRNLKGTPTAGFPAARVSETGSVLGGGAAALPSQTSATTFEGGGGKSGVEGWVVGLIGLAAML